MTSAQGLARKFRERDERKHDYKLVSVLADYPAYDLADHLADVMPEAVNGKSIWDMAPMELARLSVNNYPGGAEGLYFALMGIG